MRNVFAVMLVLLVVAPATAAISTQINPFGAPAVGTGIAIFAETSGSDNVTAQAWLLSGAIVNHDAPLTAGFLGDPNKVQRQQETAFANVFDAANPGAPYDVNDSYWGNFFTTALLGGGYNGSGVANPTGTNPPGSSMELIGGTNFGAFPAASELLLYVVITDPVSISGELAIGASTIETFGGPGFVLDLDGEIKLIPEPTSFALAGLCLLGLVFRRRR